MFIKIRNFFNKLKINIFISFILILLSSFIITFCMFYLQPISIKDVFFIAKESNYLTIWVNLLPVLLSMLLLFFISSNLVFSVGTVSIICMIMGIVNREKILLRNDPFLPWDVSLGLELAGIAKSFGITKIILVILSILIVITLLVLAIVLVKNNKLNKITRIVGSIVTLFIIYICNSNIYSNTNINNSLYVFGNVYNQVDTFNSRGFLYSFLNTYNLNNFSKPSDYSDKEIINIINNFNKKDSSNMKKPNIVFILGEAFSDMALNKNLNFDNYRDPLENFRKIKEDSISGHIVVPGVGGGTADTEFDILTGLNTRYLRGAPFSYRLVTHDFESIPSFLKGLGYDTVAVHPGYKWFYNRQNVYKYFGIDKFINISDFPNATYKGMYVSEKDTIDRFIDVYKEHKNKSNSPLFTLGVTIQNHGPYPDKYLYDANLTKPNFNSNLDLTDAEKNALSNYFEGLKDADIQLKRLLDFYNKQDEPIVVVYWGDHLPAFKQEIYNKFFPDTFEKGTYNSLTRIYKTPFIIWQNKKARETTDISKNYKELSMPEKNVISSSYLGAYVLQLLNFDGISPFFDYLNNLRTKYPVVFEDQSFYYDKTSTANVPIEEKRDLRLYNFWHYFKIFN